MRIEIRGITVENSADFLELLFKLDKETQFMMLEPNERHTSFDDMQQYLSTLDESMSALIGAFDGNNLVGYIDVCRGNANRIKHSAYVIIGILLSHTGQGIGEMLFKKADEWAVKHNIARLELTVMVHNINAIKLYEKVGFTKEGIKEKSMLINGHYVDEYYMGKILCI